MTKDESIALAEKLKKSYANMERSFVFQILLAMASHRSCPVHPDWLHS